MDRIGWMLLACLVGGPALALPAQRHGVRAVEKDMRAFADEVGETYRAEALIPGMAIGILYEGRTFTYGYGSADLENKVEVTRNTLFGIGEASVVFHGVVLARLIGEERMDLDDSIAGYLPEPIAERSPHLLAVPLRALATQTSQIRNLGAEAALLAYSDEPPSQKLVEAWLDWRPSNPDADVCAFSRGEAMTLVFAIAHAAPELGFNGALKEFVTSPLGMDRTFTYARLPEELKPQLARGYRAAASKSEIERAEPSPLDFGIVTSPEDLLTYLGACMGESDVDPKLRTALDLSLERHYTIDAERGAYMAFGWIVQEERGVSRYFRESRTDLYSAFIGMIPEQRVAVVMLSNGRIGKRTRSLSAVARHLFEDVARYDEE